FGAGITAVTDGRGGICSVSSELVAGRSQVVLRSLVAGIWQPTSQVSQSTASALDPSVALLPGGDLALAWSDTRAGHARIYYRARVRGVRTEEQPLADLPGES